MAETNPFQMRLTPGELYYAAGLLGYNQIALIGQPFSGWKAEAVKTQMLRGRQLLEERGWLCSAENGAVQMDPTFAGFVRLAASPDFFIEVATLSRLAKARAESVYPVPGARLVIRADGPDYLFNLYPGGTYDPFQLLRQVGIHQQPACAKAPAPITEKTFWGLVQRYFVDRLPLEQIRQMFPKERVWCDSHLPQLEFLATLTLQRPENGSLRAAGRRVYAGNPGELWQVAPAEKSTDLQWTPIAAEQIFNTGFFGRS